MSSFSKRNGHIKPREHIQSNYLDAPTRTDLWNLFCEERNSIIFDQRDLFEHYWTNTESFLGKPRDEIEGHVNYIAHQNGFPHLFYTDQDQLYRRARKVMYKNLFLEHPFNTLFDFIEVALRICTRIPATPFTIEKINSILERQCTSYRIVNGQVIEITSESEIKLVEDNFLSTQEKFPTLYNHLKKAFIALYDRKSPDYKKAIRESIDASESALKIILENKSTTGGDGMKKIRNRYKDNQPQYKIYDMFCSIYGMYSNEVRHGNPGQEKVVIIDQSEAKLAHNLYNTIISYLLTHELTNKSPN